MTPQDQPEQPVTAAPVVKVARHEKTVLVWRAECECGATAESVAREGIERLRNVHVAYYCPLVDRRPRSA